MVIVKAIKIYVTFVTNNVLIIKPIYLSIKRSVMEVDEALNINYTLSEIDI